MSTPTILEEIVESKRSVLNIQKQGQPLDSFRQGLLPSDRSLVEAFDNSGSSFILECKKASPSQGLIRADFDPQTIAKTYSPFASAVSVLTETEYFQGSLDYLQLVRCQITQPVLCKDFLVDPYQVYQARFYGADVILLILAIVDDSLWQELFHLAQSLSMDVITEISNEAELERALRLNAPIVGINNRDLRDMSIDLSTTRRLARRLPENVIVIGESGFHHHNQVRALSDCADGFLVGSSLMGEPNLNAAIKKLIYGVNKVCGLTRHEDAIEADRAGAVYGGVIFAEKSPRHIEPESTDAIFLDTQLERVGVFQDQSIDLIVDVSNRCSLSAVQLHGNETAEWIEELRCQLKQGKEIWKAISVNDIAPWLDANIDRLLVDQQSGDLKGGTGKAFDWTLVPESQRGQIIVAGGIGAENAAEVMQLGFAGVDMNSKLETSPGIKSAERIHQAFAALHA